MAPDVARLGGCTEAGFAHRASRRMLSPDADKESFMIQPHALHSDEHIAATSIENAARSPRSAGSERSLRRGLRAPMANPRLAITGWGGGHGGANDAPRERGRGTAPTAVTLLIGLLFGLLVGLLSRPAVAQSPNDTSAEILFQEGRALLEAGDYANACDKFEASHRLAHSVGALLNLGDCRERLGEIASAWAAFRGAATSARERGDSIRQRFAEKRAQELRPRLSYLKFQVPPESRVDQLRIAWGDEIISTALWGVRIPANPGEHEIRISAPQHLSQVVRVTIREEAETQVVEIPVLERSPEPAPVPPPAPTQAPVEPAPAVDAAPVQRPEATPEAGAPPPPATTPGLAPPRDAAAPTGNVVPPAFRAPSARDSGGRDNFIFSSTLVGLYSGVVLVDVLDAGNDFAPVVASLAGGASLGFGASFLGTRDRSLSRSTSDAYSVGLTLGAANGLLVSAALMSERDMENESEAVQVSTLAGMVLGGAGGVWMGHAFKPTRGQVAFASLMSILSGATTGLGLLITRPDIDNDTSVYLMTAGLDAGLVAGSVFAPKIDWSLGRGNLVRLGAVLGAATGWSAALLTSGTEVRDDDSVARAWGIGTLVGMWGGFALTTFMSRDMLRDPGFVAKPRSLTVLTPMALPRGAGLSLSGRF